MDLKNIRIVSEIFCTQNDTLYSDDLKYITEIYRKGFIEENISEENINKENISETKEEKYSIGSNESDNNRFMLCFYYFMHILSPKKNYRRLIKLFK
jgi:hypothetical protein